MTTARHPITGEPILRAHARAGRPNAFGAEHQVSSRAERSEVEGSPPHERESQARGGSLDSLRSLGMTQVCPFCPGNESLTPPSIAELGSPWIARAFANKYPATDGHEVIVESPDHDATFDRIADPAAIVKLSLERYHAHREAAHVAWFKNHGAQGGASIAHLHSQLLPTPFVPARIAAEAAAFGSTTPCPLCEAPRDELVIRETNRFRWMAPSAASFAHQTWIVPKHHAHEPAIDDAAEVGSLLQDASRAMLGVASSYNWALIAFRGAPVAHWYIDLFPRLAAIAGFELGTGTYIEIIDPAATTARFRA